jgi:hypothetical protein
MKSYLLYGISGVDAAAAALDRRLPGGRDPWHLFDADGDVIAYFRALPSNLEFEGPDDPNGSGPLVQADVSGRHYNEDEAVISVLRDIQVVVGLLVERLKTKMMSWFDKVGITFDRGRELRPIVKKRTVPTSDKEGLSASGASSPSASGRLTFRFLRRPICDKGHYHI